MKLLMGVVPDVQFLDGIVSYIRSQYPRGPKSMMLEIPPNLPLHERLTGIWEGTYLFDEIARRFIGDGTEIIYGDLPLDVNGLRQRKFEIPLLWDILDVITNRRAKNMIEVIEDKNPEVVIVSPYVADYIKKIKLEVTYVAHEITIQRKDGGINKVSRPYKADVLISAILEDKSY